MHVRDVVEALMKANPVSRFYSRSQGQAFSGFFFLLTQDKKQANSESFEGDQRYSSRLSTTTTVIMMNKAEGEPL